MKQLRSQRGFAVLTVLGIMLMIVIYLIAVQGAVHLTVTQSRLTVERQASAELMAQLVTQTLAAGPPQGADWRITAEPLPPGHALWTVLPVLAPQPGDELLGVTLKTTDPPTVGRFIINRQGKRQGIIPLGSGATTRTLVRRF